MKATIRSAIFCFALLALSVSRVSAQQATELYGQALGHYHKQELQESHALLTKLIDDDSKDPRVFYFRGLTRFHLDREADARTDFEAGASLEATGLVREDIPRALETVQGPARQMIEKYRRDAKRQANLEGTTDRFSREKETERVFAEARTAYFKSDYKRTRELLDNLVTYKPSEPLIYYFRGLALHGLGDADKAAADFETAVTLETASQRVQISVDNSLERVQGSARRALEAKRQVALNEIRKAESARHRAMIAQLVEQQRASDPELAALTRPNGEQPTVPNANTPTADLATTNPTAPATTIPAAGSSANAVDLAWLPSDAAVIARLNVRSLWASPFARQFQNNPIVIGVLAPAKQLTGLSPNDIESITFGGPDVGSAALMGPDALSQAEIDQKVILVVRLRAPFDSSQLAALGYADADHNGKAYFTNPNMMAEMPNLYLPDSKTIVAGMGTGFTASLDSAGKFDPRPEFDFLDGTKHLVIGYIPDDPTILTAQIPDMSIGSPGIDKLKDAAKDNLLGLSFGVVVKDTIDLQFGFVCVDPGVATELNAAFGDSMKEVKGIFDLTKATLPGPVGGIADTLLRSVKSSTAKEVFAVNITITEQLIERATDAFTEFGDQIPGFGPPPADPNDPNAPPPPAPGTPPPAAPGSKPAAPGASPPQPGAPAGPGSPARPPEYRRASTTTRRASRSRVIATTAT